MNHSQRAENNFDLIRLVAAIMVVITHSYSLSGRGENDFVSQVTLGAMQFSHLGVAVFFTISGYLITQSAQLSKSWKAYLWRRILRIFPGLVVVLLLSTFVLGPLLTNLPLKEYFTNVKTYAHLGSVSLYALSPKLPGVFSTNPRYSVNGSLWTLCYEFSLYLITLAFLCVGICKKRNVLLGLWFLMLLLRIYVGENYYTYSYSTFWLLGLNITYFFEWSFYFLSGVIVYLFKDKFQPNAYWVLSLLTLYIIGIILRNEMVLRVLNYLLVPSAVFYLSFLKGKTNEAGKYGDFSYGFYIYAFPVQQSLIYFTHNSLSLETFFVLSVVVTFPFAFLSWHLVEKRFLAYKSLIK